MHSPPLARYILSRTQFHTSARPFDQAGLLADKQMAHAVGALNRQILSLAPVLNAPGGATTSSPAATSPCRLTA